MFASSDLLAMKAIHAMRAQGRDVPADVAVVGYDDIELSGYFHPPLTTIGQPRDVAARALVDALLVHDDGRSAPSVQLPTDLIARASA
jgi:DNA-binding LacI/PurR family transcriptional regulator